MLGWCLSRGDIRTDLIRDLTRLVDAGSNISDQLGLLAVAGEVEQGRAAIIGQSRDEAVELGVLEAE